MAAQGRKPKRGGAIAILVIVAFVIIGVVAANSNGKNNNGGSPETTPAGVQSASRNTLHPPAADVSITSCSIDTILQSGNSELTITNHSSKSSNYDVQVGFFNSAGVRLDDGYGLENNVPPGGSVETSADGTTSLPAGTQITCKLVSVDRYASAG